MKLINKIIIYIATGVILIISFLLYYFKDDNVKIEKEISLNSEIKQEEKVEEIEYFDIKGAVKKPGVYEITKGDKIIDAIKKAGGLTSNATTNNINLSKKITNEMVIYIFTKKEIEKSTTKNDLIVPNCKCETVEINNCLETKEEVNKSKLVNINTSTKEELMTVSGIGESKAIAIIDYRNQNGAFKDISEILNVSGIGEKLYETIKEYISV